MKRAPRVPPLRAALIARKLADGCTKRAAVEAAGYAESTARHRASEIVRSCEVRSALLEAFQEAGLTTEVLARVLRNALQAVKVKIIRCPGGAVHRVVTPDNAAQLRALKLLWQLLRDSPSWETSAMQPRLVVKAFSGDRENDGSK